MNLDNLSYETFGNIVLIVLLFMALLFNFFPFNLIRFLLCIIQIPIYLFYRTKFDKPIHANGLNICFVLTNLFYILLYIIIILTYNFYGITLSLTLSSLLCIFGCYATSTLPNEKEKIGKLFLGRRSEDGRYKDLFRICKYDPNNEELCKYEERIKQTDKRTYRVFKAMFRDFKTWDEAMEYCDIWERKKLDKEIYAIYKTLQYVLDLEILD